MARCPSCDKTVGISVRSCPHCNADFGPQAAWKPIPESKEELDKAAASGLIPSEALTSSGRPLKRKLPLQVRTRSTSIAFIALVLWIASLFFVGFTTYSPNHSVSGFQILWSGWLGSLVGQFAWFANIFLFIAISKLLAGREAPSVATGAAVLLSLNAFTFDTLLLNEGGSTIPIYGYGLGSILWLASVYTTLLATAFRTVEQATGATETDFKGRFIWGMAATPLTILICASTFFAVQDRSMANELDRFRLQSVVFKRGQVCTEEVLAPRHILDTKLALEISSKGDYAPYPFANPRQLLEWGVPTVQFKGMDYILARKTPKGEPAPLEPEAPPGAKLVATTINEPNGPKTIRVTLTSADGAKVAFDQTWRQERDHFYCPDYQSFPKESQQPRKVLMESLGIRTK